MPDSGNMRTVYVDVKDTGCGMSPEFIEQSLFVPFKQHDSFIQGAGLGVSICDHSESWVLLLFDSCWC